jgi:phosphoglycerate dehydrogenase-like enzyme
MKAVLHYAAGPAFRRALAAFEPDLHVAVVGEDDQAGLIHELAGAGALLHVLAPVTAGMIAAAPHLRLVQKIGVGVDAIDIAACRTRGVAVCNMPGTNSAAVAEMTLALMLATLRRIPRLDAAMRVGRGWALPPEALDGFGEIGGRTVGLIGYGAAARCLAPALRALGAEVLVWSRRPPDDGATSAGLDDVLARADILSLHIPATPETAKFMDAGKIAAMKPGAILINTARGALIDEDALAAALREGRLAGAGLDVFAREPTGADHPLLALPNVVATPHLAWLTAETLKRSLTVAAENCRRAAAGEPLLHRVA